MKIAQRGRRTLKNTAKVYETQTVPAPIRGLNYRDSLTMMKPTDALRLDNIICQPGALEVRRGQVATATGFVAPVETLFGYIGVSGATKIFAAAGAGIFDATSSGAIGAAVLTGFTSAYWAQTQVSNTAGNFLMAVNGQDTGRIYDGSSWTTLGFTGLATSDMTQISVWKRRVWVVEKNSFRAWYGGADAITGAMTSFTFAGVFRKGGRLQAIVNWTVDGGAGADDFLLAITSMGEVAVYKGTDPASATTFALVGVYFVGPPVGERFWTTFGGDVLLLTADGLFPFSKLLQSQVVDKTTALTDRIQLLIGNDTSAYASVRGWEVHYFVDGNFVLIQVPAGSVGNRYQYIMSTLTGGWSRFLVSGAITWLTLGNVLYEGEGNQIANGWSGGTDNGRAIPFTMIPAFSYMGQPTRQKVFGLGRCLMESNQPLVFLPRLLVNFEQTDFFPTLFAAPTASNLWDVAIWDQSLWGVLTQYSQSWYSLAGMGYSATQVIYGVSAASSTRILALDYTFEVGGLL